MRKLICILAVALAACGSTAATGGGSSSGGTPSGGSTGGGTPTFCSISGGDYPSGAVNPFNPCQLCNPAVSGWTSEPDGTACGTGQSCVAGFCQGGGGSAGGSSGSGNGSGGTSGGSGSGSSTSGGGSSGGTSGSPDGGCGADGTLCSGGVCTQGSCELGCYISGSFYGQSVLNPADACEFCNGHVSAFAWVNSSGAAPDGGCAVGEVCYSGNCCAPSCTGKCPYASDGCGGQCPVPSGAYPGCTTDAGAEGCCASDGSCQPGTATTDCTVGGACQDCTLTSNSCNAGPGGVYACCNPTGCGNSCGDTALVDGCGNVCPFVCPSGDCCDANLDCQPGTASDACGKGGTLGSCVSCSNVSCTTGRTCGICEDGAIKNATCTGCTHGTLECELGAWVLTLPCTSGCPGGEICNGGTCT